MRAVRGRGGVPGDREGGGGVFRSQGGAIEFELDAGHAHVIGGGRGHGDGRTGDRGAGGGRGEGDGRGRGIGRAGGRQFGQGDVAAAGAGHNRSEEDIADAGGEL